MLPCLYSDAPVNVTYTSRGTGTLDGQGSVWWGLPGIGYLVRGEDRPRLFHAAGSPKNLLVERLRFINSPSPAVSLMCTQFLRRASCVLDACRASRTHTTP